MVTRYAENFETNIKDPYVLFFIKEESVRSTTIKKNLNPVYNERLFIAAPFCDKDNIAVLYIQVMDWDKISNDDNCGVAVYHININELQLGDTKQVKLNLSPEGGSISFSITHHNSITTSIMRNN
jgi:Ca2+-dependent lipid-binding protein